MTSGSVLVADPTAGANPPEGPGPAGLTDRRRRAIETALFAALVYLPILLMAPGKVESDTKSYLYLDPGRLLSRATTLWTPSVGLGGLSHQTIGYLFPMGPFYWFTEQALGIPPWVAQRLWLGTIVFFAGIGVRYMLRTLGVDGVGVPIAMVVYAFTPYVLGNSAQYSTLLGPWAALPWWIAFMVLALRKGGWKYPALFAIAVQLTGALNGTALFYALIGPALWLLYSLFVTRESTLRRTWTVVWRTGLLTSLTSLWWVMSLSVEGAYGLNLLRFTESIQVVSIASMPAEILRGLGNWYFYGGDRTGLWSDARPFYTQRFWLIFISLLIPALAMLAAAVMRWRYRAFFVVLILVGFAIAVGPSPYDNPSILGGAYKDFALTSAFGFALRNTVRAVPLIALGIAVLLGTGVSSLVGSLRKTQWRSYAYLAAALIAVVCLVNAVPALIGNYYNKALQRNEEIPQYWKSAVKYLDGKPHDTRVWSMPGTSFATYRWGDMKDPVEPGLMDRPYVDRELVPAGSEPAANLVQSLDHRLQEQDQRPFEVNAVAPIARLMGVGDVELRNDLQTDQYGIVPAGALWKTFTDPAPSGLATPVTFGNKIPGKLDTPESGDLGRPGPKAPDPKPVAVLAVKDPLPIVRAKSQTAPMVVDGDGEGLVDTAAAGLLDPQRLILYSAPFEHDPAALRKLAPEATLVVTDGNRRRGTRWSGMSNDYGYTEQAGEKALTLDPLDQRLEPFVGTTDASRTVTILSGVKSIRATTYGSPSFGFAPENRPALAMDGDTKTAWLLDPGVPVGPERLVVRLDHPITTDHLNLAQLSSVLGASAPPDPRYITKIQLTFDGGSPVERTLSRASTKKAGEDVAFPKRTFSTLQLRIDGVYANDRGGQAPQRNAVGINELRLTDDGASAKPIRLTETQRVPTDLLDALGTRSASHPLAIVLSSEPTMDRAALRRQFSLPTARRFDLTGTARLGANAKDDVIDRALGLPDASAGGIVATSSDRSGGAVARASSAIDGDVRTAWVAPIVETQPSIHVQLPQRETIDHLDLQVVADGRHSMPTRVTITGEDGVVRLVNLADPPLAAQPNSVLPETVRFPAMTGQKFTVRVLAAKVLNLGKTSLDARPIGISELGIPGVQRAPMPASLPGTCTSDLIAIDGNAFPVRVTGSTADALSPRRTVSISPCDATDVVALGAGTHQVRSLMSPRNPTGFDVSRIVLTSGAGGAAITAAALAAPPATRTADSAPRVRVVSQDATSLSVQVPKSAKPYWLVLGQSYNKGWSATLDGSTLAAPTLVDGYANGWRLPADPKGPTTIKLEWTPERKFDIALIISVVATLVCFGIVVFAFVRRRRRRGAASVTDAAAPVGAGTVDANSDALGVGAAAAPSLISSALTRALPRRRAATIATVAATAIAAALLARPWVGLFVGALVLLAILSPKWRVVLRLAPPLIVIGVATYITVLQRVHRYPASFNWATRFSAASVPVWIAVMLLTADAVISMVWRSDSDVEGDVEPAATA